jgi:hypothetical protein
MRILIFGTVYANTPEKAALAFKWGWLANRLNPDCDLMLVDSASPFPIEQPDVLVLQLGDNIGHLARGGRDGWGRAFCAGLQYAIDRGYDYVAHIEGDSLLRLPVAPICADMQARGLSIVSVPVLGTRVLEQHWAETGLMFCAVSWLRDAQFIAQYDWPNGAAKAYPRTPEWHVNRIAGAHLAMMPWRASRGDRGQISVDNVCDFDWITHVPAAVSEVFVNRIGSVHV